MVTDVESIIQEKINELRSTRLRGKHPLYRTWLRLRRQSLAKQLSVSPAWLDDFNLFVSDVSPKQKNKVLVPIDRSLPMGTDNFVWESRTDFAAIAFNHKKYFIFGEYLSVPEISEKFGISPQLLRYRIRQGWDMASLIRPPRGKSRLPE